MKNLLLTFAVCFGLNGMAQKIKETEVPAVIKDGFTKNFPGAKVSKWEKENANYEAEFVLNKIETSALFDASGNLLETETEMAVNDLPKPVFDYLAKYAPGQKIKEAAKILNSKGIVTYEAEAGDADYIFDSSGIFIKKVSEKEAKNDDKKEKKK